MKTFIVAGVVSVLFAAIATQIYSTLFASSMLALLALTFVACAGTALVTWRFGARARPARSPGRRGGRNGERTPVRHRRPGPPKGAKRESGTVKWFDRNKGFGFIVRGNGDEIFVHHRSIRRVGSERAGLDDGQDVSFVAVERQRGWQAEDVAPE